MNMYEPGAAFVVLWKVILEQFVALSSHELEDCLIMTDDSKTEDCNNSNSDNIGYGFSYSASYGVKGCG